MTEMVVFQVYLCQSRWFFIMSSTKPLSCGRLLIGLSDVTHG